MELFSGTVPVYIVPPLISLFFSIILIFVVLARGRLQAENVLFALICFIWAMLYFVFISHQVVSDERLLLRIERTVHFFFVYVGAVNVIFIHRITGTQRRPLEIILLVLTFLISLSTQTGHYFTGLNKFSWGYIARGGIFFNIFSAMSVMITLYIIFISYRCFRRERNEIRVSQADASATRKHEGTGIGLALAKELAEMHGGNITVRSRYEKEHPENHGSVFTVTLLKEKDHFAGMENVFFTEDGNPDASSHPHRFSGIREMLDLAGGDAAPEMKPGCAEAGSTVRWFRDCSCKTLPSSSSFA